MLPVCLCPTSSCVLTGSNQSPAAVLQHWLRRCMRIAHSGMQRHSREILKGKLLEFVCLYMPVCINTHRHIVILAE